MEERKNSQLRVGGLSGETMTTMATPMETTMTTPMETTMKTPMENSLTKRTTLNGSWKLDKSRGTPGMRGYLETMGVTEMAIEAHEKGEAEHDTTHTITLNENNVHVVKRSRVNNDLTVDLEFGKESVQQMSGDRVKTILAVSENPQLLEIKSSLNTINGMAQVTDTKKLTQEGDKSVLLQLLTIYNEQTGKRHITTRYFDPYTGTPPHLVPQPVVPDSTSSTSMQIG